MRILKVIRNEMIGLVIVCAAGYFAYQLLLDAEAKAGIHDAAVTVRDSYRTLSGLVNERIGTIMDEDVVAQNRQTIRDKWADLGF